MNSCQVVGNTHRKHTTSDRHYLLALLQNTSLLPVKWNSSARRPDLPLYSMVKQLSGKIMIISLPCVSLHFLNNSNTFQLQEMLRKVEAASTHTHILLPACYLQVFLDPLILLCLSGALLLAAVLDGGLRPQLSTGLGCILILLIIMLVLRVHGFSDMRGAHGSLQLLFGLL